MSDQPREKQIQNDILRAFGTLPWLRIWRANTGVARIGDRVIRFGVPGQADLTGILPDGRRLEIEVKSPTGRQSPDQQAFQRIIERFNGVYILARSVEDVRRQLAAAGFYGQESPAARPQAPTVAAPYSQHHEKRHDPRHHNGNGSN